MIIQKVILLLLTIFPTLCEAYADRFGETRKGKRKDTLWLLLAAAGIIGLSWWVMDVPPLWTGILLLVWRLCTFDYFVNWFLKKYSTNHPRINIWQYSGSTADYDKLTAKVHWVLRLVIRGLVLVGSLVLFLNG